jgi:hypothetical protein
MSQLVPLSDNIVRNARVKSEITRRSVADQIEFWAQLGQVIEPLLQGTHHVGVPGTETVRPLSECLASVDTEDGRRRTKAHLQSQPFPHYEPVSAGQRLVARVDQDGTRTLGRFVGREFRPSDC